MSKSNQRQTKPMRPNLPARPPRLTSDVPRRSLKLIASAPPVKRYLRTTKKTRNPFLHRKCKKSEAQVIFLCFGGLREVLLRLTDCGIAENYRPTTHKQQSGVNQLAIRRSGSRIRNARRPRIAAV